VCEVNSDQDTAREADLSLDATDPQEEEEGRCLDNAEGGTWAEAEQEVPEDAKVGREARRYVCIMDSPISRFDVWKIRMLGKRPSCFSWLS